MPTPRRSNKRMTLLAILRRLCNGANANTDHRHDDWNHLGNHISKLQDTRYRKLYTQQQVLHREWRAQRDNSTDLVAREACHQRLLTINNAMQNIQEKIGTKIADLTQGMKHPIVFMRNSAVRDYCQWWYPNDCVRVWSNDHEDVLPYPRWYISEYVGMDPLGVEGEDYFAWSADMLMVHLDVLPEGIHPQHANETYVKRYLEGSRYFKAHVERCGKCNSAWIKTKLVMSKRWRKRLCPKCAAVNHDFKNQPHTIAAIIGGYHSTAGNRGWKFVPQILKEEPSPLMGIEIEMDYKKTDKLSTREACCWQLYHDQLEINPNWHNFYFENDGSLNGHTGVEMITQPMTLEFHHHYWDAMLAQVRRYFKGWESSHNEYGIHVTMDRHDWSDLQLARFSKFVENSDNKNFSQAIAQRTQFYRATKELGACKTNVSDIYRVQNKKLLGSVERNSIVNLKGSNLVEFRMFKSTLNTESFFKNLEFLDAFNRWSKETAFSVNYQDFLRWLVSSRGLFNRYTNLLNYLARPTFYVKGRQGFKSEWADMITYHNKQLMLFEVDDFIPEAA